MDCPEENVIVDFARGELAKTERATVEAHIDECGACSQLVAEMARIFADDPEPPGSRPPSLPISRPSQPTLATDGAFSPSSATLGGSTKPPEQVLPQGAKLGRYVVIDRVGAGGMGVVYAAYDPELDRKVALKVLRSTVQRRGKDDQRARLIREAQAMAKLSHPNVITVHDVGTFEEQVFIAMEFIDGGTLGQWLAKERRTWREVLRVFRAAGEGLEAAHEGGLVHRDFKPDNVLMGNDGRVLVTDFGLARPAAGNTGRFSVLSENSGQPMLQASLTQTGALVGTPAYMAPEQLHGRATNALTDQFSFCVTLYEALYGERPFEGQALVELVHNVTEGNIRPAPRDAAVPRWLRRAVAHGLQIDPKDRYPSMRAILIALRRDPWRKWRRWGTVTIPTAVLGIGLMAYQQVERNGESYCDRVPEMLTGIWDDARKQDVERAFVATSRPYAQEVFDSTEKALDAYALRWSAMQTAVCRDELRAEQPQAVLALRMGCLSRRLGSLNTITDLLVRADSDTVAAAVDAARGLPALDMCEDLEALTERVELVNDPETREAAEELDRLGVRANLLIAAAKLQEAKELGTQMVEFAQAAGYRRGEAEGLYILGHALMLLSEREAAETAYHRALSAALAAGHSQVMATASVGLVWITGGQGRPLDESERWAAHGLAALEQIPSGQPRTKAELYHALGVARHQAGKLDAADEALNQGLAAIEGLDADRQRVRTALLSAKATVLLTRGDYEGAASMYEQATEAVSAAYGGRHPDLATLYDNRGSALAKLGRTDEAMALHLNALEIRKAALGEFHVMVGGSHQNIS
ncbi:MAG: protein kinase, partial [Myxococcota bacterium]